MSIFKKIHRLWNKIFNKKWYSDITVKITDIYTIPASGGIAKDPIISYKQNWGYIKDKVEGSITSGATITRTSNRIIGLNLRDVIEPKKLLGYQSYKISLNGQSTCTLVNIYQDENKIESETPWEIDIQANPSVIDIKGGASKITHSATKQITYSSGYSKAKNNSTSLSMDKTDGFELDGDTVKVTENTTGKERSCVVTAKING